MIKVYEIIVSTQFVYTMYFWILETVIMTGSVSIRSEIIIEEAVRFPSLT